MLGFGIFGYFMRRYGYPLGPVILGVILIFVSQTPLWTWAKARVIDRKVNAK